MIDKPVEVQLQADMLGKVWVVFGPVPATQDSLTIQQRQTTSAIPESVNIGDKTYWGQVVSVPEGMLDLGALFKSGLTKENRPYNVGDRAYLMAGFFCAEATELLVGAGADWWMKWWIDGLPVFDTFAGGNQSREFSCFDHAFKLHLEPGEHQVCVEVRSGSTGWMLASTADHRDLARLEEVYRAGEAAHQAEEQKREAFRRQAKNASRYKDFVIYRSCLDAASLASLASGRWLRSSLHLLAPLDDTVWKIGIPVANCAQTGERLIPRGAAKPFPQQAINLE